LGPSFLALVIASSLALLELLTAKYPRTFFLARSWTLLLYALVYGLIAFGATYWIGALVSSKTITLQGIGLSSPLVQAIAIGVSAKALLHIRLFNVTVGSEVFPIGIESVMQIFEPWLLRTIELNHWNAMQAFVNSRSPNDLDLAAVKKKIIDNLPTGPNWSAVERSAFAADVRRASDVPEAMRLFVNFLGKKTFDRVFPPPTKA
jgi:hypothetical protein